MANRLGNRTLGHDATLVAKYLLFSRENVLTPMQVLKLVYICHGWMLGLYRRPLIREAVEAWTYGPVVPTVYHAYKKYRGSHITEIQESNVNDFRADEQALVKAVMAAYEQYTGIQLSTITHKPGTPWAITHERFGLGSVISNDLIEDHYLRLTKERR